MSYSQQNLYADILQNQNLANQKKNKIIVEPSDGSDENIKVIEHIDSDESPKNIINELINISEQSKTTKLNEEPAIKKYYKQPIEDSDEHNSDDILTSKSEHMGTSDNSSDNIYD